MTGTPMPTWSTPVVHVLKGAWDAARHDELAALLFSAARSVPALVVLDLSEAVSVDRPSLAMIQQYGERLRHRGGGLSVVAPGAVLAGGDAGPLPDGVTVYASIQMAVHSMSGGMSGGGTGGSSGEEVRTR